MTTLLNRSLKLAVLLLLAFAAPQVYAQASAGQPKAAAKLVIALNSNSNTTASEKTYTLYEVQNFPIIEGPACTRLVAMDDREHFDYDLIFASARSKKNDLKDLNTGTSKHKIAPKLTT